MVQDDLNDKLTNYLKRIAKLDVLVIDDFLLTPTTEPEQKYLMEVLELRSRDRSLIILTQMETGEWYKKLGGRAIADAIYLIVQFQILIIYLFMESHLE